MQVETDVGRIVVRPMHRQHIFETALVATEAFLVDRNPPEFQWMLYVTPLPSTLLSHPQGSSHALCALELCLLCPSGC